MEEIRMEGRNRGIRKGIRKERGPREWARNLNMLKRIISRYKMERKEVNLLINLYRGYLFNFFKGFDVDYLNEMDDKAEKLKMKNNKGK